MAKHGRKKVKSNFLKTFIMLGVLFVGVSLFSYYMVGYLLEHKVVGTKIVPQQKGKVQKTKVPFPEIVKKKKEDVVKVFIYFGGQDGRHFNVVWRFIKRAPMDVMLKDVIEELLKGPSEKDAISLIPKGTILKHLFIGNHVAYLDFNSAIVENHPGGSRGELLTIYSIVDTVVANFLPKITAVQILVDGKIRQTLKGHIDISHPLVPDKDIN